MMIKHIQQPEGSKLCGHSCVAMVLGVSLDEAIEIIGHRKGVRNYEIIRALGTKAATKRSVRPGVITPPCIIRIKGPKRRHHVALYAQGKVFDPAYALEAPDFDLWHDFIKEIGWRIVSVFPLNLET